MTEPLLNQIPLAASALDDRLHVPGQPARLELRARDPDQMAARAAYLDLVGVAPGSRGLDVGCGSGAVTRRVHPTGRVIGLDPSPAFLAIATELVAREGLHELRLGDARALPFVDAEFDVVLAVTTLAHMPEAKRALAELVRVVRRSGRVGIFDLDGGRVILAHPDRAFNGEDRCAAAAPQTAAPSEDRRTPVLR